MYPPQVFEQSLFLFLIVSGTFYFTNYLVQQQFFPGFFLYPVIPLFLTTQTNLPAGVRAHWAH